jgi:hypothetical protein
MTHTPGPWRICGGERKDWIRIDAGAVKPDGDPDCERGGETLFDTNELNNMFPEAKRRVIADYLLAAAAPELLEVAKFVHEHAFMRKWHGDEKAFGMLERAIAKAEGKRKN